MNLIYFWMRDELSKLGKEFPLLNSSFDIYAEFQYRISHDTKLRKKYHRKLILYSVISVTYIIIMLLA